MENEIKKMAEEYAFKVYHEFEDATWFNPLNLGYYAGYKKAKETLFTEEDLKKAIDKTILACNEALKESYGELIIDEDEIIQSLKKVGQDEMRT